MPSQLFVGARYVLAFIFIVFGLNAYFHFLPIPPNSPRGDLFITAMTASGYLMILVKVLEVACGLLLLLNRRVPLALILLGPIVVNIFLFHAVLERGGFLMGLLILVLWGLLIYDHRAVYRPLFRD